MMETVFDFRGEPVKRRLLLMAVTTLRLQFHTVGNDPWVIAVRFDTPDDAYRLGIEHGRMMIEEGIHANADTH